MQDRIPLYPGRVKMTPVAGQANTYDMTRADDPTQAGTPLNKASLLKDATAALFGLTSAALPDDVLAEIGKYKQYWWRMRTPAGLTKVAKHTNISSVVRLIQPSTYQPGDRTIQVSTGVEIDQSTGVVTLTNPENFIVISTTDETIGLQNCQSLVGKAPCYISNAFTQADNVYYLPVGSIAGKNIGYKDDGDWVNDPSTSTVTFFDTHGECSQILDMPTVASGAPYAQMVTYEEKELPAGDWQYVQSSNRNAYPDSGTQDGYEYEYLGVPFDNAVTAPKIETGSYVGTGTYGESNPNTLTFGFVPKMVWIYGGTLSSNSLGYFWGTPYFKTVPSSSISFCNASVNGTTFSWYNNQDSQRQLNSSNYTFCYFAIG